MLQVNMLMMPKKLEKLWRNSMNKTPKLEKIGILKIVQFGNTNVLLFTKENK